MKKFYYLAAGIVAILVTIIACEKSAIGVDEIQTLSNEEVLLSRPASKVVVCHWDDGLVDGEYDHDAQWITINISENALEAHYKHGDKYDWDGDGFYPENECGIMGDKTAYDCDDDDVQVNPDVDDDSDGFSVCDDCDDGDANSFPYSPMGEYTIDKSNGALYQFNLDTFDKGTGIFSNSVIGVGHNNNEVSYSKLEVTAGNYNSVQHTWDLTIKVWVDDEPGVTKDLIVTVDECGGITSIITAGYILGDN